MPAQRICSRLSKKVTSILSTRGLDVADKLKVGIIGCGNIFPAYIKGCRQYDILDVVACADMDISRAQTAAQQWNIPTAYSVDDLLADPSIQIVINLTPPQAHATVSLAAIRAGKHIYSEKPLALNRDLGHQILDKAKAKGALFGCAPLTSLGGGF